ncbi:alanine racemase [Intestinibacter bartlettii]|uniref:Alanine racemase n=2 Tax=Intestinibacter bartlettii TaxID=261299 RepID=A0ABS6DY30_9FIRM|nr:alanine racemase [Intestinibacter bartlettii]
MKEGILNMKRGTWAEINLNNIKHNFHTLKNTLKPDTKVCCVVKADAYGHGAVEVAKMLQQENADYFSVARFEEAIELRNNNIHTPILCMGYISECDIEEAIHRYIGITVYSYEMAKIINQKAGKLGKKASVHIKIDTGMSRLGFLTDDNSINDIIKLKDLINLNIDGIYTHFATADEADKKETYLQLERYKKVIAALEKANIEIQLQHVSNTAAIIDLKELGFNMVRLGIGLYGYYPSDEVSKEVELKPAMKLKTIITNIKKVAPGTKVSYGYTYEFDEASTLATLAIGYADGFDRTQNDPKVMINGVLCDVVGRICMDQCMVKIPEGLSVNIEDEVLIMGDEAGVTAEDLASKRGTINYEVLCSVSRRVTRYYILDDETYSKCYL